MNYLDIALIIPIIYGLVQGFSRGIVKEITSLVSLIIGIYIAFNFSFYLETHLEDLLNEHKDLVPILSFAIVFAATLIVIKVIGYLLEKITNALALGIISKLLGAIFGSIKVGVILSALIFFEQKIEVIPKDVTKESLLKEPLEKMLSVIIPEIADHEDLIKDLEKKAKEATEKIKKGL
tara:strand:+ start:672 stop:1208 length:537 start_codon:yes stop_codon:yes gene_type:complete